MRGKARPSYQRVPLYFSTTGRTHSPMTMDNLDHRQIGRARLQGTRRCDCAPVVLNSTLAQREAKSLHLGAVDGSTTGKACVLARPQRVADALVREGEGATIVA